MDHYQWSIGKNDKLYLTNSLRKKASINCEVKRTVSKEKVSFGRRSRNSFFLFKKRER